MKASDIMVRDVITIDPDATIPQVADLLLKHRISALPVVDGTGSVVGIIGEGDLLHRAEAGTEIRRSHWLDWMISPKTLAAEFVKSHSRRVSDVMIRQVISVSPEASLGEVATILEKNAIRRVPVVDNGKLVGILSRADIVRALMARSTIVPPTAFQDPELHDKVTAQLGKQTWTKPSSLSVVVHDGTVELWGVVDSEAEKDAVRVAAETTPGVGAVDDHVLVRPTEFA